MPQNLFQLPTLRKVKGSALEIEESEYQTHGIQLRKKIFGRILRNMYNVTWTIEQLAYSSKKHRKTEKRRTSQFSCQDKSETLELEEIP